MLIQPYAIGGHNRHYEGAYSDSALEWRQLGAIDKATNLASLLGGRTVGSVLEVGCGTGAVLAQISQLGIGRRHVGIDLADPKEHLDPTAHALDLRAYDGVTLPFADRSFDLVVASHVIEHVPNPRALLAEMARVSVGLIYVEVPCEIKARMDRRSIQAALDTGHINAYTPEYFMVLLQTAGLDVLDFRLFDHSDAVHRFGTSALVARLRMTVRRALLRANPILASRVFCFHCGALVRPASTP